jgi:3-deoxy-manno-octulosonate cytidylyltransferase (CMP-KDO synthetase)
MDDVDVVVNIQADEPFIDPVLIDNLIESFDNSDTKMATLVSTQLSDDDIKNENVVKAILNEDDISINFVRKPDNLVVWGFRIYGLYKHLGIYSFTKETLLKFIYLKQSKNEKSRKLEQMRALDNKIEIKSFITDKDSLSINVKEDIIDV